MIKELTLRYKIILVGITAVFISLLITGSVIHFELSNSLLDIYKKKAVQLAKDMSVILDITIQEEIKLATVISTDQVIIKGLSAGDYLLIRDHLKLINKANPSYPLPILIIDKSGFAQITGFMENNAPVDVSDRKYFKDVKNGKTGIEGPITSRYGDSRIFMIAKPMYNGKEFIGAVAIALNTDFFVKTTSSIKLDKTGYAFITDNTGLVLVHPNKDYIFNVNLFKEPGMENLSKQMIRHETGAIEYTFRGTKKIAGIAFVDITGWTVGFTQNRDEIMEPVNHILISIALIGGSLFLIIAFVIIILFSGSISSPVQRTINLLNQLTLHSDNIIINISLDRKILFVNQAAEKILGTDKLKLIGTEPYLKTVDNIPYEKIWEDLKCGKTWSGNITGAGKTNSQLTLAALVIPIMDSSGKIQSYLEIARDITEELHLQTMLRQSQKMEALGAMAGGIAHDFNNILGGILGFTELAMLSTGNPPDTERSLREIMTASERARDLINQILLFSRQSQPELRPLMPAPIIKEAIKMMRASIPAEIELRSTITSDSTIMAEPIQLHQIVVNLCTNAVHAIENKRGFIEIVFEDIFVDETFIQLHPGLGKGRHVSLRITDSGKGMSTETMEHIFEPFFTTKPQGQGTGLGLSVVHGIIKKLNGIITVDSVAENGTTFNIILPAISIDIEMSDNRSQIMTGGSERILLIDDELSIIEPLRSILTNLGYKVTSFTESTVAFDVFKNNPNEFDIIITDYSMPHMTGIELIENIKKIRSDIPVIVNSGYINDYISNISRKIGIDKVLAKPVNTYQLTDAIRKVFTKKQ